MTMTAGAAAEAAAISPSEARPRYRAGHVAPTRG